MLQLHNQSWSHVDTNDMSEFPIKFAKETWKIDFTDHCRPENHPLPHQHTHDENETGGTKKRNPIAKEVPELNNE